MKRIVKSRLELRSDTVRALRSGELPAAVGGAPLISKLSHCCSAGDPSCDTWDCGPR